MTRLYAIQTGGVMDFLHRNIQEQNTKTANQTSPQDHLDTKHTHTTTTKIRHHDFQPQYLFLIVVLASTDYRTKRKTKKNMTKNGDNTTFKLTVTSGNPSSGLKLQTMSLTLTQTGNATPRSIAFPLTFFVYNLDVAASMTVVPNSHNSKTLAPTIVWETNPSNVRLTTFEASWYFVHTSLK